MNDEGKRIRDYYRIPKREVSKLFANIVESSLKFLETREPKALKEMGVVFLENIMPVSVTGENFDERVESVVSSLNPLFKGVGEYGLNRNAATSRHYSRKPKSAFAGKSIFQKHTANIPHNCQGDAGGFAGIVPFPADAKAANRHNDGGIVYAVYAATGNWAQTAWCVQ